MRPSIIYHSWRILGIHTKKLNELCHPACDRLACSESQVAIAECAISFNSYD
jgi:hypothetical protein